MKWTGEKMQESNECKRQLRLQRQRERTRKTRLMTQKTPIRDTVDIVRKVVDLEKQAQKTSNFVFRDNESINEQGIWTWNSWSVWDQTSSTKTATSWTIGKTDCGRISRNLASSCQRQREHVHMYGLLLRFRGCESLSRKPISAKKIGDNPRYTILKTLLPPYNSAKNSNRRRHLFDYDRNVTLP